ncbi:MAG: exodeoxyribonuclease V subunit gamma, partial [Lachnospiraceae bacterium]|nr:exodeoxyribonuclease V subunit gamma [Lachnospiraceae bacterium]
HAFVENNGESGTMLSLIKNDLLNMTFTPMTGDPDTMEQANVSRKQRMVDPDDSSIQFHSCATPLREVQVLYDHMLEKFREDKTLRPRDIAVFMPNVGVYAPYIEAVFGTNRELLTKKNSGAADKDAEPQKVDLPYTICDRTTAEECPEIDGFNKLMNIVSGRIDNKTLFMLLSIDAIRSRFGIEADDLEQIKKWFNDNNIVFGLDEEDTNIYDVNVSADKKDSGSESNPFFVSEYAECLGESALASSMFRQYMAMETYFAAREFADQIGADAGAIPAFDVSSGDLNDKDSVSSYMIKTLEQSLAARDSNAGNRYVTIVDEVKKYIDENFGDEELSLNKLASHVNFSPNHLSMIFSQQTGETFIKYLTDYRMNKAKELLRCTSKRGADISYEVGYKDPHYFSFLFKKTQGMTPTQYRNGHSRQED